MDNGVESMWGMAWHSASETLVSVQHNAQEGSTRNGALDWRTVDPTPSPEQWSSTPLGNPAYNATVNYTAVWGNLGSVRAYDHSSAGLLYVLVAVDRQEKIHIGAVDAATGTLVAASPQISEGGKPLWSSNGLLQMAMYVPNDRTTTRTTADVARAAPSLEVTVSDDLSYVVTVGGQTWLHSSPVRAYFEHTEFASPTRDGPIATSRGTDSIGAYTAKTQRWTAGSVGFTTAIKTYPSIGALGSAVVFETTVPEGARGTNDSIPIVPGGWPGSQGNVKPIVAFPAFATSSSVRSYFHDPCTVRLTTVHVTTVMMTPGFLSDPFLRSFPTHSTPHTSRSTPISFDSNINLPPPPFIFSSSAPHLPLRFPDDVQVVGNGTSPGLAALDQLRWQDNFCYYSHGPALTLHGNTSESMLGQGVYGGPIVLHERKNLTANPYDPLSTLVVAPLDNVKHHGSYRNDTINSAWEMGVYSQVTSLPPGFSHRTLMLAGAGVTATVARYGALAMKVAGTNRSAALAKDVVVNYLGYWTDSGAYYYADIPFKHNLTAMAATLRPGATMEDVSVAVKSKLDEQKVPVKYWQWDDWWYPGHAVYVWCVQEWEMVDYAFPSGLEGMHSKLGVPFLYYMPYWCQSNHTTNTPSEKKWVFLDADDCGWECEYTFVRGAQSKAFHVELFNAYKGPKGMSNYEQDFMVTNFVRRRITLICARPPPLKPLHRTTHYTRVLA